MSNLKKATFALPEPLLYKLKELAKSKRVPSANAAVREALEKYLAEIDRKEFQEAMQSAVRDADFMKDLKEVELDFRAADSETARKIGKW